MIKEHRMFKLDRASAQSETRLRLRAALPDKIDVAAILSRRFRLSPQMARVVASAAGIGGREVA